jgi:hypothetical protein
MQIQVRSTERSYSRKLDGLALDGVRIAFLRGVAAGAGVGVALKLTLTLTLGQLPIMPDAHAGVSG